MRQLSKLVMDPKINPLAALPPAQRFQTMVVLSVRWTTLFCTSAGLWFYYGALVLGHLLLLLGEAATGFTFHSARKTGAAPERAELSRRGS